MLTDFLAEQLFVTTQNNLAELHVLYSGHVSRDVFGTVGAVLPVSAGQRDSHTGLVNTPKVTVSGFQTGDFFRAKAYATASLPQSSPGAPPAISVGSRVAFHIMKNMVVDAELSHSGASVNVQLGLKVNV